MLLLAVRISRAYHELSGFWDKLVEEGTAMIVYQHDADEDVKRTHVHAVIQVNLDSTDTSGIKVKVDTWKARIKKYLNVTAFNKADWSFVTSVGKPKSPVKWDYITYMSKGNLHPVATNHLPEEIDYDAFRLKWVPMMGTNMKVQYKIEKYLSPADMKKTYNQMIDEIISRLADDHTNENVLNVLLKYVAEKRLIIGRYKIRDMYDTILLRTCDPRIMKEGMWIMGIRTLIGFPVPRTFS